MATTVYNTAIIHLVDGTEVLLSPLKIRYLREFMEVFDFVKTSRSDEESLLFISECARVAMKQYYPKIKTVYDLEDNVDLPTIYKILEIAAGIKMDKAKESEPVKDQISEDEETSWSTLDLAKLEAEVFMLGIWKDYNELESSLSMPELILTLSQKRELDHADKKFAASIQGVELDSGKDEQNAWERMKAKVFSKGQTSDANDVLSLQGVNAQKAGFGIGMGLSYERID